MKIKWTIIFELLFLIIFSYSVHAENQYVTERMRITLRSGPDMSYKVIGLIASSELVTIIENDGDWTKVRDTNGKVGWVMTRFLTTDEPKINILTRLEKKYNKLSDKVKQLDDENKDLSKQNKILSDDLAAHVKELKKVNKLYNDLLVESANYINLKMEHETQSSEFKRLQSELQIVTQEKEILESKQFYYGFGLSLTVLIVGFLIGKSNRKKRSSRLI